MVAPADGVRAWRWPLARACPVPRVRLNLAVIEASLREVQAGFDRINAVLEAPRDPFDDQVLAHLLAGYRYLDQLLADGIDPLARGHSRHLLNLNLAVLYGEPAPDHGGGVRPGLARERRFIERRFYDDASAGGLRALVNYLAEHQGDALWRLAAGVYIQVVAEPQMFIEGNHRTGVLVISSLLCRAGHPPLVLTSAHAQAWLDHSAMVKGLRKRSLKSLLGLRRARRRLAGLLAEQSDRRFLR